jgi:hypothetical protein
LSEGLAKGIYSSEIEKITEALGFNMLGTYLAALFIFTTQTILK